MFKPGFIREIEVQDFVTYSYIKMYPGPNLNMVIGPNGSGKSTIVAAIILGLGGNPKTVGRGHKVSEYIKHNCEEAQIKIVLQGHGSEKVSIVRQITLQDKTTWYVNKKKVVAKDVQDIIDSFNIQVDNLCQFLPQDRVQDFAKLNKQQLLINTQSAICRNDLIEKQEQLITNCGSLKELRGNVNLNENKLKEFQDANGMLEGRVQGLSKKKGYLTKIEHLERKISWVTYENLREKRDQIKEDRIRATKVLKSNKDTIKPMESAISTVQNNLRQYQTHLNSTSQSKREIEHRIHSLLDKHRRTMHSINEAREKLHHRLNQMQKRQQEIADTRSELENLQHQKAEALKYANDHNWDDKIIASKRSLSKISGELGVLNESKGSILNRKRQNTHEINAVELELEKIQNIKQRRLEWLRYHDKDVYSAVLWLRKNEHIFKGKVYEPMILELDVLDPKYSIYIENTIPFRDRVAFTCVYKQDMQLLIDNLRVQQKLVVNVLHSGEEHPSLNQYPIPIPIANLRQFGMHTYILSLITGPEPIMKYLCRTFHIHRIPVGDRTTNSKYLEVPPELSVFFSDTSRFSISRSRYTGEKSVRQVEIKSDGSFALSTKIEKIHTLENQRQQLRASSEKHDELVRTLDEKIAQLHQDQSNVNDEIRQFQMKKHEVATIDTRIRLTTRTLEELVQEEANPDEIRKETNEKIQELSKQVITLQSNISNDHQKLTRAVIESDKYEEFIKIEREEVATLENKIADGRKLVQESEQLVRRIEDNLSVATRESKIALKNAKGKSNGFVPTDTEFNQFREEYDKFDGNLETLAEEKERMLAKIDCLRTADYNEVKEYEERKEAINNLQRTIDSMKTQIETIENSMDVLKNEWLTPLGELVEQINQKFGSSFESLGCVGEVSIYKGEKEDDFTDYGLSVKVKYRPSQPLQELNGIVQSGGERAVATAVFMLSLQELTPVPFRCVDEINQGMDSTNERKIFDLLFDVTTRVNTSQYFFITPKLIPKLNYCDGVMVHIVHNGPFINVEKKWRDVFKNTSQS